MGKAGDSAPKRVSRDGDDFVAVDADDGLDEVEDDDYDGVGDDDDGHDDGDGDGEEDEEEEAEAEGGQIRNVC